MNNLTAIESKIRAHWEAKNGARDAALAKSRELIRYCSLSIRATHRAEYANAQNLLANARDIAAAMRREVAAYPDLHYTGYVQDALKELTEAHLVFALITNQPIPDPDALGVDYAAYMNGLGEAATELRRYILDIIRHPRDERGASDPLERPEAMLQAMDDVYNLLVTMDFPDAITGGLRRQTDIVRGVLEKTRGDLTVAWRQEKLEERLKEFQSGPGKRASS